ncbi:MAG TPA: hypothetical protein VFD59_13830 [Nocardioidaceae bacterium]|nr:hypothetical protein [Nocardioidaceae bacterium]
MKRVSRVLMQVGSDELSRFLAPEATALLEQAMAPFEASALVVGLRPPESVDIQFTTDAQSSAEPDALSGAVREALGLRPGGARLFDPTSSAPALRFGGTRGPRKLCPVCGWGEGKHDPDVAHP